jgi:hypothetical protein
MEAMRNRRLANRLLIGAAVVLVAAAAADALHGRAAARACTDARVSVAPATAWRAALLVVRARGAACRLVLPATVRDRNGAVVYRARLALRAPSRTVLLPRVARCVAGAPLTVDLGAARAPLPCPLRYWDT